MINKQVAETQRARTTRQSIYKFKRPANVEGGQATKRQNVKQVTGMENY